MKKILLLLGCIGFAMASYATTENISVSFVVNSTLAVTPSSTALDFGDVIVSPGNVSYTGTAPVLSISSTDAANVVIVTTPSEIDLTDVSGSTISYHPSLSGTDGSATTGSTTVTWTSTNPLSSSTDVMDVSLGGSIALVGTETPGNYTGTQTVTVSIN